MTAILETVAAYVPGLAIRRRVSDPAPIKAPEKEEFQAAVLLADVSGFTRLTETLAQRGPEGAEEMTRALNAYFGQLIEIIHAHGGDVAKFAGDAMLVVWPDVAQAGTPGELTCRAAQCALALQREVGVSETIPGAPLSLHCAIGAGEMAMAHIGGVYGRWEFVVTGTALVSMGGAAHLSKTGEVVLTPDAWALLRDRATGDELEEGCVRLTDVQTGFPPRPASDFVLPEEAGGSLRAFLPGAIRARLDAGQTGWLA
ncbi:MAG: adenylate/guanylate cyclase domain-containing protein, partial [Candidatus Sericytochromatia bacterium]|nr:adenylate/guanylate cyclase domain-containing protein [Candidatus Tanganyikabacteria bacterium]